MEIYVYVLEYKDPDNFRTVIDSVHRNEKLAKTRVKEIMVELKTAGLFHSIHRMQVNV